MKNIGNSDVLVAGGGTAGFAAAVAAARAGSDTILIERNGIPGGVATAGLMNSMSNHICTKDDTVAVRGIVEELIDRVAREGGTSTQWRSHRHTHITYDVQIMVPVMLRMLKEANVRVLLHTQVVDIQTAEDRITDAIIQHTSGRYQLSAKAFVDATGSGALAVMAGEPHTRKGTGGSLLFMMANVDLEQFVQFLKDHPEDYEANVDHVTPLDQFLSNWYDTGIFQLGHGAGVKLSMVKKAIADGTFKKQVDNIFGMDVFGLFGMKSNNTCMINSQFCSMEYEPWAMSDREIEAREMVCYIASFIKQNFPGFHDSYVSNTAGEIGLRSEGFVHTQYEFSQEDKGRAAKFDDVMAAGPAVKYVDTDLVMDYNGKPVPVKGTEKRLFTYEIPYRVILPQKTKNLWVVSGKCLSNAVIRQITNCLAMGQAGGVAASLAARDGRDNDELDIRQLQKGLLNQNVYLAEDARLEVLGLG